MKNTGYTEVECKRLLKSGYRFITDQSLVWFDNNDNLFKGSRFDEIKVNFEIGLFRGTEKWRLLENTDNFSEEEVIPLLKLGIEFINKNNPDKYKIKCNTEKCRVELLGLKDNSNSVLQSYNYCHNWSVYNPNIKEGKSMGVELQPDTHEGMLLKIKTNLQKGYFYLFPEHSCYDRRFVLSGKDIEIGYKCSPKGSINALPLYILNNLNKLTLIKSYTPTSVLEAKYLVEMGIKFKNTLNGSSAYLSSNELTYKNNIGNTYPLTSSDLKEYPNWVSVKLKTVADKQAEWPETISSIIELTPKHDDIVDSLINIDFVSIENRVISRLGTEIHNNFELNLNKTKQENIMIKITKPTLVDGVDVDTLSSEALIDMIEDCEGQIEGYKVVKVKSAFITKQIGDLGKLTRDLAKLLDRKNNLKTPK